MIASTTPQPWNSAYKPIVYEFTHEEVTLSSISNNGGYVQVNLASAFTEATPVFGSQLLLDITVFSGGSLSGVYTVSEVVSSTSFVTTALWPGSGFGTVQHVRLPTIYLYAGYNTGEGWEAELPLTLVATITPRNSPTNTVRLDVSGFLQGIFTMAEEPELGAPTAIDFNLFNRFRLYYDGAYRDYYQVLNSTIDTADLNEYYVETNRYLCEEELPLVYDCGYTILCKILDGVVKTYLFSDGALVTGADFAVADFDADDFKTT